MMKNFDQKQVSSIHLGKHFICTHLLGISYVPDPVPSVYKH